MSDNPQYNCDDEQRREDVLSPTAKHVLNGIDYLEVVDGDAPAPELRQRTLLVFLLRPPVGLSAGNVRIEGGAWITGIHVTWAYPASAIPAGLLLPAEGPFYAVLPATVLVVRVDFPGDFSPYRLRIVQSPTNTRPPADFDPRLSSAEFSFKVECPTDFDCKPVDACPPDVLPEPEINYLARDYNSFRRLILDRFSLLMPDWQERNAADMQIMLAEIAAYVGDHLSYFLDAVVTEQYLGTALHRISVRRHTRLLDYHLHEGCNARAWIVFKVNVAQIPLPKNTKILSRGADDNPVVDPDPAALAQVLTQDPVVFETMLDATLRSVHNEIHFYTWHDRECCLPRGSTRATLLDDAAHPLALNPAGGDILIFEETASPSTGLEADRNPDHRCAVRLTKAESGTDPLDDTPVVAIEWAYEDALTFPLCISALVQHGAGSQEIVETGLARGNVVLADHGLSLLPFDRLARLPSPLNVPTPLPPVPEHGNFRPAVPSGPLTYRVPFDPPATGPASDWMRQDPRQALPVISLTDDEGVEWTPHLDLLSSPRFDPGFVVEVDSNGLAYLRFGDDLFGRRPLPRSLFDLTYRVGSSRAGNVGADALTRIVPPNPAVGAAIDGVRNPLSATGGQDPEPLERARLDAPEAFRVQERAVTMDDYTDIAGRYAGIQRAAATLRWTGSWYTVFVTVDRRGGLAVNDPAFRDDFRRFLDRYRMAGLDLELDNPIFVPLELVIDVCVKAGYRRADVKQALLDALSARLLPGSQRGFFHPDNFTFGQPVYLSQLYQAASAVPGVDSLDIRVFQRYGKAANQERENGVLTVSRLEIIRMDNDPNFPEHGKLTLNMDGGL